MHETKSREWRLNAKKALTDFENELNPVIDKILLEKALKIKRQKENNNAAKLKKAKEKALKHQRWRKYTKQMRKTDY